MRSLSLAVILLLGAGLTNANAQTGMYQNYDRSTQQTLQKLEQLINLGDSKQATELITKVINGVGYILPLAKNYYRLAQNETDCELLAQYYLTIVTQWPQSAWAQQAVIDYIPILLMSSERFGSESEIQIWENMNALLSPADDAESIPEKPDVLRQQVYMQLILLAHHRREAQRVIQLQQNPVVELAQDRLDAVQLSAIFARMRLQEPATVEPELKQWLQDYPDSDLRSFVLLTLYEVTGDNQLKEEIKRQIFTSFKQSVEAEMLKGYISEGN